jgi:hypothetical protein
LPFGSAPRGLPAGVKLAVFVAGSYVTAIESAGTISPVERLTSARSDGWSVAETFSENLTRSAWAGVLKAKSWPSTRGAASSGSTQGSRPCAAVMAPK